MTEHIKFIDEKLKEMEKKKTRMLSEQQNHVLMLFTKHREDFTVIEKSIGLEPGLLANIVPLQITDLKKDTLLADDLKHARGIFSRCIEHFFGSIPPYYASILATPGSVAVIAREVAKEAAKHTSAVGIFFRNLFYKRTTNDIFYIIAKYYETKFAASKQSAPANPAKSPLLSQSMFQVTEERPNKSVQTTGKDEIKIVYSVSS